MRVSFKPCVHRHRQRKDKTFSVTIRIGYQSKYAFIETNYSVSKADLNKSYEIKNQTIINKCNAKITEYTEIVENIDKDTISNVQDIVTHLNKGLNKDKDIDFIAFFKEYLVKLKKNESASIQIYSATYNHFCLYVDTKSFSIKKITPQFLTKFEEYLQSKKIGSRGQNLYLSRIRSTYNVCIDEYEHLGYTFSYPFRKYKLSKVKPPKTIALTKDQLLSIIDVDLTGRMRAQRARIAFVISLLTLGTNATDLYDLNTIRNGRLEYSRNKTKDKRDDEAFFSVKIEPELTPYIELVKGKDEYIFCFRDWYRNKPQFNKGINKGLEQVVKKINIEYKEALIKQLQSEERTEEDIQEATKEDFIHNCDYYDARRTIASVMRNKLGISKDDVSFCLNHVDMAHKTTDFYLETDFSILDLCNRRFIDWIFENPTM